MRMLITALSGFALLALPTIAQDAPPVTTHDLDDGICGYAE